MGAPHVAYNINICILMSALNTICQTFLPNKYGCIAFRKLWMRSFSYDPGSRRASWKCPAFEFVLCNWISNSWITDGRRITERSKRDALWKMVPHIISLIPPYVDRAHSPVLYTIRPPHPKSSDPGEWLRLQLQSYYPISMVVSHFENCGCVRLATILVHEGEYKMINLSHNNNN